MGKGTGILLDPDTGDLQLSSKRNKQGLIAEGLVIGETAAQNQAIILQSFKGEFKEYPTLGVGISDILSDNEPTGWRREIALQLESDGMKVRTVDINFTSNKLIIDADYRS